MQTDLQLFAQDILAGANRPYGIGGAYSPAEWEGAAEYAIEGDSTDLEYMIEREEAFERFSEWQARDFDRREDAFFDDWFDARRAA